jgi:hypothetical protein
LERIPAEPISTVGVGPICGAPITEVLFARLKSSLSNMATGYTWV